MAQPSKLWHRCYMYSISFNVRVHYLVVLSFWERLLYPKNVCNEDNVDGIWVNPTFHMQAIQIHDVGSLFSPWARIEEFDVSDSVSIPSNRFVSVLHVSFFILFSRSLWNNTFYWYFSALPHLLTVSPQVSSSRTTFVLIYLTENGNIVSLASSDLISGFHESWTHSDDD